MKYEMPAVTEERRAELVNLLINRHAIMAPDVDTKRMEENMEIVLDAALAALTSEVRGSLIQSVNPKSGNVAIFYRERGINSISPEEITEWEMSEIDHLYSAPPVSALKTIELNGDDVDTPVDWYSGAKTRDMVIDVIRAAGYEVKD